MVKQPKSPQVTIAPEQRASIISVSDHNLANVIAGLETLHDPDLAELIDSLGTSRKKLQSLT